MSQKTLAELKAKWITGYRPSQADYVDLFDSFYNILSNNAHYVGELYGGGIIIALWYDSGVQHGLIASLTNLSTGRNWSNVTSGLIGVTAQSPTNGKANSDAIIAQAGHTDSAASICEAHAGGGFNDWYLPSLWEAVQCMVAAPIINKILGATDGFVNADYWTSTESDATNAYVALLSKNTTNDALKSASRYVRAIRNF